MRASCLLLAAGICVLPWLPDVAPAEAARLCIVPVPSVPDKHYPAGQPPPIMQARTFPGSRWPIFKAFGAITAPFVLNASDELEISYRFPINLYDYVSEPSGRVIGFRSNGSGVQLYIQDPANGRFVGLGGTEGKAIGFVSSAAWISGRRATIVGTSNGLFSLEADKSSPRLSRLDVQGDVLGKVRQIYDLPSHQAAAISTDQGRAYILGADNRVREVPGLRLPIYGGVRFGELDDPERLLIEADKEFWTAPLHREGGTTIPGRAREIGSYVFDGNVLQYYPAIHRYLVYAQPNGWLPRQHALLELGDELTAVADSTGLDYPHLRNLGSRGVVSVQTFKRGIFIYDGKSGLKPVPQSTAADIGAYPKVYEVTGQGKVLVLTITGLYELTTANRLDRIALPAELEGAEFDQLAELPASHIAVIFSDRGAFALDSAGTLTRIPGTKDIDLGTRGLGLVTPIPVRDALFAATNRRGSFLILDEDKAGSAACARHAMNSPLR